MPQYKCPICNSTSHLHDVVDFSKNCEEVNGNFLPKSGIPIYYAICGGCDFLFAPDFTNWTNDEFRTKIYNNDYQKIDPDYIEKRPNFNFNLLNKYFSNVKNEIFHLDYGGGNGSLSVKLNENGWNSKSYDPFSETSNKICTLGKYNLITAFEVFEHASNPNLVMEEILDLIDDHGIIFLSTLINDGNVKLNQRLDWWYASPRNGHISLFSSKSLKTLGEKYKFTFASMGIGYHVFYKKFPSWGNSLVGT